MKENALLYINESTPRSETKKEQHYYIDYLKETH